jgi:hypothetical protein
MSVATLFQIDRGNRGEKRDKASAGATGARLKSLMLNGFGASEDAPEARVPRPSVRRETGDMGLRDYLRGLETMVGRSDQAQIRQTLVSVSPSEVQALVDKTAKAKARYIAATLDLGNGESLPDSGAIKMLEAERERHEALESGLRMLIAELRAGHVKVDGVSDDATEVWQDEHRFE